MSQITPVFPIRVEKILSSFGACPYQLEFLDSQGNWGYLRYRGGYLRCGIAKSEPDFYRDGGEWTYNVIDQQIGDQYDGVPNDAEFKKHLEGKLILPDGFSFENADRYEIS